MAKRSLIRELDDAVEAIMTDAEAPLPKVDRRLAALLRIAADMRGLPSTSFKERLKAELLAETPAARPKEAKESASRRRETVQPIPEGFHSITPYLQVQGASRMIDFLKKAFAAEELFRSTRPDGDIVHAQLRIHESMIELADASAEYPANPTAIHLYVKDVDATYERALKSGASSMQKPAEQDYGDREAGVKDPFGNNWYIATHRADADPLPKGLHNITPYLHPKGTAKVIDFLKQAFEAEEVFRAQDPQGTVHHAKIRIGDSIVELGEAHGPYQPMPPALHLYVKDTDSAYSRAVRAGATSISRPADQPYGDRSAGVKDPFGNVWYIATHIKDVPLEEFEQAEAEEIVEARLPEASAPVRGGVTPHMYIEDAAGAAAFYTDVFGAKELMRIVDPTGVVSHVQLEISNTPVMIRNSTTEDLAEYVAKGFARTPRDLGGTPLHLYVYVKDADATFNRALQKGSSIVDPIDDKDWGDRCGGIKDPYGHIWYIATPLSAAAKLAARKSTEAREALPTKAATPYTPGQASVTPTLCIRDAARAIEFYRKSFGASVLGRLDEPSGKVAHAEIKIGDSRIAIADEEPAYNRSPQMLGGTSAQIHLYVQDVDAFVLKALAGGAKLIRPISNYEFGERIGKIVDPFGHVWMVGTRTENVPTTELRKRVRSYKITGKPGS